MQEEVDAILDGMQTGKVPVFACVRMFVCAVRACSCMCVSVIVLVYASSCFMISADALPLQLINFSSQWLHAYKPPFPPLPSRIPFAVACLWRGGGYRRNDVFWASRCSQGAHTVTNMESSLAVLLRYGSQGYCSSHSSVTVVTQKWYTANNDEREEITRGLTLELYNRCSYSYYTFMNLCMYLMYK